MSAGFVAWTKLVYDIGQRPSSSTWAASARANVQSGAIPAAQLEASRPGTLSRIGLAPPLTSGAQALAYSQPRQTYAPPPPVALAPTYLAPSGGAAMWDEIGFGDVLGGSDAGVWDWGQGGAWPEIGNAETGFGDWARIGQQVAGAIYSDTPGGGSMPVPIPGVQTAGLPAMGAIGGAVMGAGRTLASLFSRMASSATFNINGVRGTMPQLWRYTRKYGPAAVAQALGITVGALGAMLLSAPDAGRTRRRRGISARDIRTTKRVVGFVSRMASQIGCVRAPRHFRRRKGR